MTKQTKSCDDWFMYEYVYINLIIYSFEDVEILRAHLEVVQLAVLVPMGTKAFGAWTIQDRSYFGHLKNTMAYGCEQLEHLHFVKENIRILQHMPDYYYYCYYHYL